MFKWFATKTTPPPRKETIVRLENDLRERLKKQIGYDVRVIRDGR